MSVDINSVTIVGRVTRDAESRTVGDKTVAAFGLAVGYYKKGAGERNEETSFFDVEQWDSRIVQYLKKGTRVAIHGELRQDRWEKDGQKNVKVKILARSVQLLDKPAGTSGGGSGGQAQGGDDAYPW